MFKIDDKDTRTTSINAVPVSLLITLNKFYSGNDTSRKIGLSKKDGCDDVISPIFFRMLSLKKVHRLPRRFI